MKIAILGSKNFDSLEYHLADTLSLLGHEIFHLDIQDIIPINYRYGYWAIKMFPKYDNYIFKNAPKPIIGFKPDLIICTYRFINPICIKLLKKSLPTIPIIHINPDALTTFEHQQIFASPYDFYFTKDPYIVSFMKEKNGLNAFYLPEAFNPRVHKKPAIDKKELEEKMNIDVAVFGSVYPYRLNLVRKVLEAGINVTMYGSMDKRFFDHKLINYFNNEYITGERKSELLYGSKIVFNNFHYAEIESVNVKFFEIFGIGAFQICDYRPTVDEYSKIDSSRFTFGPVDEAIEKIKFYLANPELRNEISLSQYEHFIKHHTYENRIDQILRTVFS